MALRNLGKLAVLKLGNRPRQGTLSNIPSPGSDTGDLRLESRPTPMFPMVLGGVVAGLVITGVAAAALVRVDQVVSVPGTLKTLRSTQDVKTPEGGVITSVLVKEGEQVTKGAPLVTLDPTVLRGREQALREQSRELGSSTQAELLRLQGSLAELDSIQAGLRSQIAISEEQLERLQGLEREGAAARFQLLDYQKQLAQLRAQLAQNHDQRIKLQAESSQKQSELAGQLAENRASRVETSQRLQQVVLRAPAAGTILNITAKVGQVVGAGEVLLQLVPTDNLRAEAFINNRDLAFVRPGQKADISVQAYDRSKYGTIDAKVTTIATDALPPNETYNYPHFPIGLQLQRQHLEAEGKRYPLQAGMAIAAELRLEKRTVLELFLSSFLNTTNAVRTIR
jgi:HlyD family secretion protein